jgi:hypothetical protein
MEATLYCVLNWIALLNAMTWEPLTCCVAHWLGSVRA